VTLRPSILISALSLTAVLTVPTATPAATANPTHDSGQSSGAVAVPDDSLRALASRVGLRIGTAVNTDVLATNATYRQITADQFSSVTPENVMKWQVVEPTQGTYDWSAADKLVKFAEAHGQLVRGHTLVWHSQLPTWLTAGTYTSTELRDLLRKHITDEVTHFKGNIWQWDVVNEAFNDDGTMRKTIWLDAMGPSYIADAFRWAHQADPKALLFYNDYNIEGLGPKSDAVYALAKQLRAQGVPIDGIGAQGHLDTKYGFPDRMQQNLQRFADLGLKVALTEVDVRTTVPDTTTPEKLAQNADYSQMLEACLLVRACISYTVWGFGDAFSWVPSVFKGEGAADIYDENLQPKASYFALQQTLMLASGAPHRDGTGAGRR
jgi:endo-1,4-beta-xylanase